MGSRHAFRSAFGLALALTAASPGRAAFVTPTSWARGGDGTTHQEWDVFDSFTNAAPDVADNNANGSASLTENTGGGFITGGGNIYAPMVATDFTVTVPEADVPTPAHNVTAVVQVRTLGSEMDYGSIRLNGLAPIDTAELDRQALGGFGGSLVDAWLLFAVPYADFGDGVAGVEDLTLTFNASASSMSLDRLSIDTAVRPFGFYNEPNPVPEPASLVLLTLGGGAVMARRR